VERVPYTDRDMSVEIYGDLRKSFEFKRFEKKEKDCNLLSY